MLHLKMQLILFIFYSVVLNDYCAGKILPFSVSEACTTQECYETGYQIKESLNKSIDPCIDFYNYACGGWITKTSVPNWEYAWDHWQSTAIKLQERLEFILDYPQEKVTKNLKIAQNLYGACMSKRVTINQLLKITKTLKGWPLNSLDWKENSTTWINLMLTAILKYNVYPLFKIEVKLNLFNTTSRAIYIEPGDVILPESMLLHPLNYIRQIDEYKNWIRNVSIYVSNEPRMSFEWKNQQILDLIEFEMQLATLRTLYDKHEMVTLKELSKETNFNWKAVINGLLGKNRQLNFDDNIIINGRNYINQLMSLLRKTKLRDIANFVIWSVINDITKYGDENLEAYYAQIEKSVLNTKGSIPRSNQCVNFVTKYAGYLIMPKYIEMYVSENVINEVRAMAENIKYQFMLILKRNKWLSDNTREMAIEKISRINYFIGYPKSIFKYDSVRHVDIPDSQAGENFDELLIWKENFIAMQFDKLWKVPTEIWPENLFEVNAFYSILQNTIVIPIALLDTPFFNLKRPSVYNYGSLGFIIAHEMSHALDNIGRKIDPHGDFKKWWTDYDLKKFKKKIDCFEKQYNNGFHTLSENIADNIGLQISFESLMGLSQRSAFVLTPYLENYTKKQLFFISFAQLWCEIEPTKSLIYDDAHAPNNKRVFATLKNNPAFDKAFYCPLLEHRCNLW